MDEFLPPLPLLPRMKTQAQRDRKKRKVRGRRERKKQELLHRISGARSFPPPSATVTRETPRSSRSPGRSWPVRRLRSPPADLRSRLSRSRRSPQENSRYSNRESDRSRQDSTVYYDSYESIQSSSRHSRSRFGVPGVSPIGSPRRPRSPAARTRDRSPPRRGTSPWSSTPCPTPRKRVTSSPSPSLSSYHSCSSGSYRTPPSAAHSSRGRMVSETLPRLVLDPAPEISTPPSRWTRTTTDSDLEPMDVFSDRVVEYRD